MIGRGVVLTQRYEVAELIGRGGMADVYRAHDRLLERDVAVKVFRADPTDLRRFRSEVTTLARLNHPNLVRLFDAGEHEQVPYFVLELVTGPTLASRLAEGPLSPAEVTELAIQVADALAYVHEAGIVHRDVKPSNILLTPDGRPLLSDFGVARLVDASAVTATGVTVGSAAYLAPEQASGGGITAAVDVYALGLVLLEALTGRPSFDGTPNEMLFARLSGPPTLPSLPHPWTELLGAMLAQDPQARPQPRAIIDALNGVEATQPIAMPIGAPVAAATVAAVPIAAGPIAAGPIAAGPIAAVPIAMARPHGPLPRWALPAGAAVAAFLVLATVLALSGGGGGGSLPQDPASDLPATTTTAAPAAPAATAATTLRAPSTTVSAAADRRARCRELERQKAALDAQKKLAEQAKDGDEEGGESAERAKDQIEDQKKALEEQQKLAGC